MRGSGGEKAKRTRLRHILEVVAEDLDLVLLGGAVHLHIAKHLDLADNLLTEEVADLEALALVGRVDVDGEMSVDELHLELVALGDSDDHVLDVGHDGANAGSVLGEAEPDLHLHLVLSGAASDVASEVLERLHKAAAGTLHGNNAGLHADSHWGKE